MKIPWNQPKFGEREIELVTEVLKEGYVSEGPKTKELESKLAEIVGCKHIIMTTSCTAALYLALETYKRAYFNKGKRVVIPNLTFVATLNACQLAGMETFFMDSGDRYLMQENHNADVDVFIPVNLLGRGVSKEFISAIKQKRKFVICDNAGCLGSDVPIGDIGCYSLQANKIISSGGQGGFCATDDDQLAETIRQLKDFGRSDKYQNNTTGFNFKFNDVQSAVGLGQLEMLEDRLILIRKQYDTYKKQLKSVGKLVEFKNGENPLWIEFISENPQDLVKHLESKGISARLPWNPINMESRYPVSLEYGKNVLWLPSGPHLKPKDIKSVCKEVKNFYANR